MCIIGICENRKLTIEEFTACWNSNQHGFGYAHWTGNEVIMKKGIMEKERAWNEYKTVPLPHIVHFRIASAGGVCPELTHPFLCTADSELVLEHRGTGKYLFHNGTVSDWKNLLVNSIFQTKIIPHGSMSDSRAMAIAVSIVGEEFLDMYATHKWVCVNPQGITVIGDWIEAEGGVKFSNGGFRTSTFTAPAGYRSYWNDSGIDEEEDGDFHESFRSIMVANRGKKTCRLCVHYEGDMTCAVKGALRDDIPCVSDYTPLPGMRTSQIGKKSKCSNCIKCDKKSNICMQTGNILKDNRPCYYYLNERTKQATEWLKTNQIEVIPEDEIDPCGARATIKDGRLISVQSNFLERLQKKYSN